MEQNDGTVNTMSSETSSLLGTETPSDAIIGDDKPEPNVTIRHIPRGKPVLGAVFIFTTSTLGAGVLNLPFILKETGIAFAIALIFIVGCLSASSLTLLHQAHQIIMKKDEKLKDYEDMGQYCFGWVASTWVKCCVIMINFGSCIGYLVILGSLLRPIVQAFAKDTLLDDERVLILIICVPIITLALIKRMSDFRFISYMSISAVLLFVLFVVLSYQQGVTQKRGKPRAFIGSLALLRVVGVVMFSYSCHTSLCAINQEYDEEGQKEVGYGIFGSVSICACIYTLTGLFGYLCFIENTQSNLLRSFNNAYYNLFFRGLFCFTIFFTYPIVLYPVRISVDNFIRDISNLCAKKCLKSEKDPMSVFDGFWLGNIKNIVMTFLLGGLTVFLAIVAADKVEYVFSLTGSVASTFSDYILPGFFYLKLTKNGWFHPMCLLAYLVITFGIIFGPIATVITILGFFGVNV